MSEPQLIAKYVNATAAERRYKPGTKGRLTWAYLQDGRKCTCGAMLVTGKAQARKEAKALGAICWNF